MGSTRVSGRSPEKEMATHSSILAWEIPPTEDPGGLQSMGSQKESDMTQLLSNKKTTDTLIRWTMLSYNLPFLSTSTVPYMYFLVINIHLQHLSLSEPAHSKPPFTNGKWSAYCTPGSVLNVFYVSPHLILKIREQIWFIITPILQLRKMRLKETA